MKNDKEEAALQEQNLAERNLSLEQRKRVRDVLRPVLPAFAVQVYAQECAMRVEEAKAPDSPMGEYCRLMLQLRPEERSLVEHSSVPKSAKNASIIIQAAQLRVRLLSFGKPRRGYPWEKSAV